MASPAQNTRRPAAPDIEDDQYDPLYLQGIDEFNTGNFFVCHEIWEDLWRKTSDPRRRYVQGLIQAAVALYHRNNRNFRGAGKLLVRCRNHLEPYRPHYMGLNVTRFLAEVSRCVTSDPLDAAGQGNAEARWRPTIRLEPDPGRDRPGSP